MIGDRIKALRKERGLSQSALALRMGLTQQAVGKWEAGRSTPDYHMLVRLARALRVEPDLLFDPQDFPLTGNSALSNRKEDFRRRWIAEKEIPLALPHEQKMVPVLGAVKAGYGLPAEESGQDREPAMVKDSSRYFYLVVQGDSMEPRIRDQDLALVRKQPVLDDGDLGVFVVGGEEGTIKRFHKKGDCVELQAFNPAYETLVLRGEELEKLYIIGKVVETKTRWL